MPTDLCNISNSPSRHELSLVAILCLTIFTFAHWKGLTNPYICNDDVRQQIFWMNTWADSALYHNDPFSEYARSYVPSGVKALYWLPTKLGMNAVYFSKLLTGCLFVILGVCLFSIGYNLEGQSLAWAVICVFWLMPSFIYNMSGGISRSFASHTLALFILCWMRGSAFGMGMTLMLQALCIPYIYILSAATCLLASISGRLRNQLRPPFPRNVRHLLLLAAAAGIVFVMSQGFDKAGYGPLVGKADMLGRPEFTEQGRLELYPQPGIFFDALYYPLERVGLFLEGGLPLGIITLTLILGSAIFFSSKVDWHALSSQAQPLFFLAAGSFGLYVAARIALLKLFVPDRYISYSLYMFYCLGLAVCFQPGFRKIVSSPRRATALILCIAVLGGLRLRNEGLFDYSADAQLYEAIHKLPKDSLIAGHPNLMDNVLTFGQRKVFASYKLAHPWSKGWWGFIRPRVESFFRAYYASNPESVRSFCRKNSIDFLLIDPDHFKPEFIAKKPFFAPFDSFIREITKDQTRFAVLSEQDFPYTLVEGKFRLIDMRLP